MTDDTTTAENVRESELATRLGLARSLFTDWRKSGELLYPEHFGTSATREIWLSPAGLVRVEELLKLPAGTLSAGVGSATASPAVEIIVTAAGANPRNLRGRVVATSERCTVRLQQRRVFATQFALGTRLLVTATETANVFDFDGKAPKKMRI